VVVQRGCDRFCTYCVVPLARGAPFSRPWQEVVEEIRALDSAGIEEVVLAGINMGLYDGGLARLVHRVLEHTDIARLRISSLEPFTVEKGLIDLMAEEPRICRHVHLSLQHGSDRILAAMGRPTRVRDIRRLLETIFSRVEGAAVGSDIIVGFPGEDDRDFMATYALVEEFPFAYLHVFPFSPRPYTRAAGMFPRPAPQVVAARSAAMRELSRIKREEFAAGRIGSVEQVLVTGSDGGHVRGITSSYLRVSSSGEAPAGGLVPVRITGRRGPVLTGEFLG
ncbi:MAG TPA: radical SAM protein, partial [Deltaproteobacteria bacterium]|nr:radical SAM protein [Deltaproteobacteria bacterium]